MNAAIHRVAHGLQRLFNLLVSVPGVVADEVCDIFQNHELGAMQLQDFNDVPKNCAAHGVIPTHLTAGFGERLAGESRAKQIMLWDFLWLHVTNVAARFDAEVLLIDLA